MLLVLLFLQELMYYLLDVLQKKTKGNIGDDDAKELTQLLSELRARFVQISKMVQEQQIPTVDPTAMDPTAAGPPAEA